MPAARYLGLHVSVTRNPEPCTKATELWIVQGSNDKSEEPLRRQVVSIPSLAIEDRLAAEIAQRPSWNPLPAFLFSSHLY